MAAMEEGGPARFERGSGGRDAVRLIPVIDLMGGVVVRGEGGRRESYRPIETKLADGAGAVDVTEGLLRAIGADGDGARAVVYVADLDAIMGGEAQVNVLRALVETFASVTFWVDAGFGSGREAAALRREVCGAGDAGARFVPVLGSETLANAAALGGAGCARVLSLDFGGAGYRGDATLLEREDLWPEDVIVMSLAQVGSGGGPDLERLRGIVGQAGWRRVYAAGGVRGREDMAALERIGVAGALVASAIHDGRLGVCRC